MPKYSHSQQSTRRSLSIPTSVLRLLECPVCDEGFSQTPVGLTCHSGHSFDRARQGYVSLRTGKKTPLNADSPAMVNAREELLGSGLYARIRDHAAFNIAEIIEPTTNNLIVDLAGGTGYYLAGILEHIPRSAGLCIDLSASALRRAARSHPRAYAIGADLRRKFPIRSHSASVVTSFFGPRNISEIQRILSAAGYFVVVTPTNEHLHELVEPLGMIGVDPLKDERLAATLEAFTQVSETAITYDVQINLQQARSLASMGPSAHHISPEVLAIRLAHLSSDLTTTVSVNMRIYRLRESEGGTCHLIAEFP